MNNYDYPEGADNESAPWNEKENEPREVEVSISMTLSKNTKIKVTDYELNIGEADDGFLIEDINFDNTDLLSAVEEQVDLPSKWHEDWNVDEIDVNCKE